MNNYIVTEPVAKMREIARKELKGYWKPVAFVFFIYYLLTSTVSAALDVLFAKTQSVEVAGQMMDLNVSAVGSIYTIIVLGAFSYGIALFALTFFRTKRVENSLLFEGFSCLGKAFALYFLMVIKVILWTFLFIIPGIIASFRYSQAFFVMCDHPEYSARQCIAESKRLMAGNKSKLFILDLSYIGWIILASFLMSFARENIIGLGVNDLTLVLIDTVLFIPLIFVEVYLFTGLVVFYEILTRNLVIVRKDQADFSNGVNPDNTVNADYQVNDYTNQNYASGESQNTDYNYTTVDSQNSDYSYTSEEPLNTEYSYTSGVSQNNDADNSLEENNERNNNEQ